jgi:hypothetical protein
MTGGRETPQPLSWKVHQIQIFENLRSSSFGKGGNEAYDAVRNPFSHLSEVDFGRYFHLSELIQASGHGHKNPFIPKAIKRSSMDAEVQGFSGPHQTAFVLKKRYSFFSGRCHGS